MLFLRFKSEANGVDAISQSGFVTGPIFENMSEMRLTLGASHFHTSHAMTVVLNIHNGTFLNIIESRPSAT